MKYGWVQVSQDDYPTYNRFDEKGRRLAFIHTSDCGNTWILVAEHSADREVLGAFINVSAAKAFFEETLCAP